MTETNFDPTTFVCEASLYSTADCAGQPVRWQIIVNSNGVSNVTWFAWFSAIGSVPANETAYYYAMNYLSGGQFTGVAANVSGTIWTAPFLEASGVSALWVWTPSESGTTFTVPANLNYTDYRDLDGNLTSVTPGQTIAISVEPVMLEVPNGP